MVLQGILRVAGAQTRNSQHVQWNQLLEDEPAGLRGIFASVRRRDNNVAGRFNASEERNNDDLDPGTTAPEVPTLTQQPASREEPTIITPPTLKLQLGTLNIQDGQRNRLNAALRSMRLMEVDIGILTEMKFSNNKYTKYAEGYTMVGTKTNGRQGRVALFYSDRKDGWVFESTEKFGPNVIRTTLVSGNLRFYIIGLYIPPSEEDGQS